MSLADSNPVLELVEAHVVPLAEELGLEVYDLQLTQGRNGPVVVIVAERADVGEPGTGVTVAELTKLNRQLSDSLELEQAFIETHALEVTSPGVERELKRPRDFQRMIGQTVRVVLMDSEPGQPGVLEGPLTAAEAMTISVEHNGESHEVFYTSIRKARNVFQFNLGAPPSTKQRKSKRRRK